MKKTEERLQHEIEHGKKIQNDAEGVWNWSSPAGQIRAERRANLFVETAKINKKDSILEIGCGTGLFTRKVFHKTGAKITATDLSPELLNQAKELLPQANFIVDDAMKMKFPDNSFDVVFGSSILHHLEIDVALREIFRVLKPDGRMVFAEPNMVNPQILIQKNIPYIKEKLGDSPDETAIFRWGLKKVMTSLNYQSIRIFPYDFLHPITPKSMIRVVSLIGKTIEKIPILKEIAGSVIIYGQKPN